MKKDAVRCLMRKILLGSSLIAATGCLGCARPEPPAAAPPSPEQAASAPAQPLQQAASVEAVKLPPPNLRQVKEAINVAYQNTVTLVAQQFCVGDFDGDGSQDLAVVVKPANGMLPKLNSEYARWKLDDPHHVIAPNLHKTTRPSAAPHEPVQAAPGERLLAIVHGQGPYGWRHPGVNNAYLLVRASGHEIAAQPEREFFNAAKDQQALPSLRGDVIQERMAGAVGFLYYTGAAYAWFERRQKPAAPMSHLR